MDEIIRFSHFDHFQENLPPELRLKITEKLSESGSHWMKMWSRTSKKNHLSVEKIRDYEKNSKKKDSVTVELSLIQEERAETREMALEKANQKVQQEFANLEDGAWIGITDISRNIPPYGILEPQPEQFYKDNFRLLYRPPKYASVDWQVSTLPGYIIELKSTDPDITLDNFDTKKNFETIDVLMIVMSRITTTDALSAAGIEQFLNYFVEPIIKGCHSNVNKLILVNLSDAFAKPIFAQAFKYLRNLVMQSCTMDLSELDQSILPAEITLNVDNMKFPQLPILETLERLYAGNLESSYRDSSGTFICDNELKMDLDDYILVKHKQLKMLGLTMNCPVFINDELKYG